MIKINNNFYEKKVDKFKKSTQNIESKNADFKLELVKTTTNSQQENLKTKKVQFDLGGYSIQTEDKQGHLIKISNYDSLNNLTDFIDIDYKDDGSCTQTCKNSEGLVTQITEKNSQGKVIANSWFDRNGNLQETSEYIYDKDTEIIITRDSSNEITSTYGFNTTNNQVLFKTEYDTARQMWSTTNYEKLENGYIKEKIVYENGWVAVESIHDAQGSQIEYTCFKEDGRFLEQGFSFYNANNESFSFVLDENSKIIDAKSNNVKDGKIFDFSADTATIGDYDTILQNIEKYTKEIITKLEKTTPPAVPIIENFPSEDDYEKALKIYNKSFENYDNKINEYHKQLNRLELASNICTTQKQEALFDIRIEDLTQEIKENDSEKVSNFFNTQFKAYTDNFHLMAEEKYKCYNEMSKTQEYLSSIVAPIPPIITDDISEKEYNKLYKKYETEMNQYDKLKSNLELHLKKIRDQVKILEAIMNIIYSI